ncbi:MAG: alpha/beta hydrolase [Actinobacteria bacterium]|nr:alpha/beta hydrolase [Actinomycetota bacterium]
MRISSLTKKSAGALVISALLVLTGCAQTTSKPFPHATNDSSTLDWHKCEKYFQCATMSLPMDYQDASMGTFDMAVIRFRDPNQQNRLGSLIVNPGGPGVSGIDYALNAQYVIDPDVLDRYDIVGFDPRGIGKSTAIHCLSDAQQDESFSGDAKPESQEEFNALVNDAQTFAANCVAKTNYLASFTTENTARDMEQLRIALGDSKLNYMGFSYGTYLGTKYAQQFPTTVGRFVLDGAIDPTLDVYQQNLVQAQAFDKALANFTADCLRRTSCPLPKTANSQFFVDFLTALAEKPLTSTESPDRPVTQSLVVTGAASALYDNQTGWPMLRTAFEEANNGDGTTFLKLADAYSGRNLDGTYMDNQNDANIVIDCLDWYQTRSNEGVQTHAADFAAAAPVFGPYVAFSGVVCNSINEVLNIPMSTDQNTVRIEKTATPVLIIGTTQDPATPYAWAKALSNYIVGSRLITLKGEGHTGYGRGSTCTDAAVDAYLITGKAPAKSLVCTH